jgi:hypothetical protein
VKRGARTSLATFAFVCVFASTVAAGCARDAADSLSSGGDEGPRRASISPAAAAMLVAQAPAVGKYFFGHGLDVSIFKPSFLFGEARAVGDTLYVTYNTTVSPYMTIATLFKGRVRQIPLLHDYYQITFENGNRVISAVDPNGRRDWYELQAGRAVPIPAPATQVIGVPLHVLEDGDSCTDGMAGTSNALDEIRAHHRIGILTRAAIIRATHGSIDRITQASCDHFDGANYVTMDAPGLVWRLDGDRATPVVAGWIEAADERHLLIEAKDSMIDVDVR